MNPGLHTEPVPRCSVAMTTWNGARFLTEQLDSILQQTFPDFELVISDDASTDGTRAILETYAAKDPRVRLFFQDTNLGYRENFYFAIRQCRAEWILLCDQDDRWLPHKIEVMMQQPDDALLLFSDSELISETGMPLGKKLSDTVHMLQPGTASVNRGFVIGNCAWGHTILFRKELLQYAGSGISLHPHDWWLAVVSSHLQRIRFVDAVLHEYRQHAGNLTQAVPKKDKSVPGKGRKQEEYETQLARMQSIRDLPFNTDRAFYARWAELYLLRKREFPISLFFFLLRHQRDIFRMKRKNWLSRLVEIRKMCRKC